jgi:5-formyltetrahydrofolate cyclo-ligase
MFVKTKEAVRKMILNEMITKGISGPDYYGRIPDFKGSKQAAELLRKTSEWKKSDIIFVGPDTALIKVRENCLVDVKTLIMASPKLLNGYIIINPQSVEGCEKEASTIKGAFNYGTKLESLPDVDMVVEGSVAVDITGGRLGKGGGYGDMEISHLIEMGAIKINTPVVSTVHDIQIIENVPNESHDQKINMIVTPQNVFRINH